MIAAWDRTRLTPDSRRQTYRNSPKICRTVPKICRTIPIQQALVLVVLGSARCGSTAAMQPHPEPKPPEAPQIFRTHASVWKTNQGARPSGYRGSYRPAAPSAIKLSSEATRSTTRWRRTRMGAADSGVSVTGLPLGRRFLRSVEQVPQM